METLPERMIDFNINDHSFANYKLHYHKIYIQKLNMVSLSIMTVILSVCE